MFVKFFVYITLHENGCNYQTLGMGMGMCELCEDFLSFILQQLVISNLVRAFPSHYAKLQNAICITM